METKGFNAFLQYAHSYSFIPCFFMPFFVLSLIVTIYVTSQHLRFKTSGLSWLCPGHVCIGWVEFCGFSVQEEERVEYAGRKDNTGKSSPQSHRLLCKLHLKWHCVKALYTQMLDTLSCLPVIYFVFIDCLPHSISYAFSWHLYTLGKTPEHKMFVRNITPVIQF